MSNVSTIFGIKPIKGWVPKLKPVECAFPDLIMGLELETEHTGHGHDFWIDTLGSAWSVDRDGSLRGDDAFEFISKPIALKYLLPEVERFFGTTKFNDTNYSDRCSVHVHTNVLDYTQDQVSSLAMVYSTVEEVLFQFINHVDSPTPYGYSRDTNIYCIPWNQCRMNQQLILKMFSAPKTLRQWQKYTALNLLPMTTLGTVEWRHLHGTANIKKISTWLNIIGSIMSYASKTPVEDVVNTIKGLNDTSAYHQFFDNVFQGYLEWNPVYQTCLYEGILSAKFAMINWKTMKGAPPIVENLGNDVEVIDDMENTIEIHMDDQDVGGQPRPNHPLENVRDRLQAIRRAYNAPDEIPGPGGWNIGNAARIYAAEVGQAPNPRVRRLVNELEVVRMEVAHAAARQHLAQARDGQLAAADQFLVDDIGRGT